MRKNAKLLLTALLLFCVTTSVNAEECDYSKQVELNTEASTVKAIYEETEIDTGMTTYDVDPETDEVDYSKEIKIVQKGFNVKIMNLTKNLYVRVSDDYTGNSKNYYYSDTDKGTIVLDSVPADEIHNYTIDVSAYGTDCSEETLRTINLITPIYNEYSELAACDDYPEFQYCQKYFTAIPDLDIIKFQSELEEYKKDNKAKSETETSKKNSDNKVVSFLKKNIVVIIIIAIVGVATSVILVKRKRSRLI